MNYKSNADQAPQTVDATICSIESSGDGLGSMVKVSSKPEEKVKAYVDFSEFNKNYMEHLKSKAQRDKDEVKDRKDPGTGDPSKTPEDWEILT